MTVAATLYTKPGCHLCEDAVVALARLRARYPHHLLLVDITADSALLQEYGLRVPVLAIGGHEFDAPLPPNMLERALQLAETGRQ